MICIVSGTNRQDSNTLKVALRYMDMLEAQGAEVQLIDLAQLPENIAFAELYGERTAQYQEEFILKVEKALKFVFVLPEYNGGFPQRNRENHSYPLWPSGSERVMGCHLVSDLAPHQAFRYVIDRVKSRGGAG